MVVLGLGRIDGWAASTVYSTGFESDEGFDLNLKLSGQNGWKDSGFKGHGIVTNFLSDPGQQAYIGFNRPTDPGGDWEVWRPVDFRPQPGQSDLLTFSVRFAIHPSTTTNHDDFRWSAVNSEGTRLFSIDFDGNDHLIRYASSGGEFVKTEFGYTDKTTYLLKIEFDFRKNLWKASIGPSPIVTPQLIRTGAERLDLAYVSARWVLRDEVKPGDGFMVFDDYQLASDRSASDETPILSTSFESAEGYEAGFLLGGQAGWARFGTGGSGIVTNFWSDQPQTAYIGFAPPTDGSPVSAVARKLNYRPQPGPLSHVHFSARVAVYDSDGGKTSQKDLFLWSFSNIDGVILFSIVLNTRDHRVGYSLGKAAPVPTQILFTNQQPFALSVEMDFASNQWSARFDDREIVADQSLGNDEVIKNLGGLSAIWGLTDPQLPGNDFMIFDTLRVVAGAGAGASQSLNSLAIKSAMGVALVRFIGQSNTPYAIESSEDLRTWKSIRTLTSSDGIVDFADPDSGAATHRFYRTVRAR